MAFDLRAKHEALKLQRLQSKSKASFELWLERFREPSRHQYVAQKKLWEEYKIAMSEPEAVPDTDHLETFTFFCAVKSKGRLAGTEFADEKTLSYNLGRFRVYYNACHEYQISTAALAGARDYLHTRLKIELNLQNKEREKEFADWEDIKIVLHHIIVEDPHIYHHPRFRAQLVCIFLLIADDGERLGAVARSESYRKSEEALCYEDVVLLLQPSNSDRVPELKMEISFNNRKGERDNKDEYLVQTYYQRSDLAHCVILWILVLAFLDDAFENVDSPEALFSMKNLGSNDKPIRFKKDLLSRPIFRRMKSTGSVELSDNLPWSSGSITNETQRIFAELGFPQRWTFYNVRRGVNNKLDTKNVSASRRKQLMGHEGDSDKVFRKYYQSRKVTVDTGNIFRGEEPRPQKSEVLNMHSRRDPDLPEIPHKLLCQTLDEDKELQNLLKSKTELIMQLENIAGSLEHGYDQVTINAAIVCVNRALNRRRVYIKKHAKQDFRKSWFENPELIRAQHPTVCKPRTASRADLAEILYSKNGLEGSVEAIRVLVAHCTPPNRDTPKVPKTPKSSKKYLTPADLQRIEYLKTKMLYTWTEIAAEYPDWTIWALSSHYKRRQKARPTAIVEPQPLCVLPELPRPRPIYEKMSYTPEDDQLMVALRHKGMKWPKIGEHFPGRSLGGLRSRYSSIMLQQPYSSREHRLITELRNKGLGWPEIASHFHGQLPATLKNHYHHFLKKQPIAISHLGKRAYSDIPSAEKQCFKPKRRRTYWESKYIEKENFRAEVDSDLEEPRRDDDDDDGDDDDDDLESGDKDNTGSIGSIEGTIGRSSSLGIY